LLDPITRLSSELEAPPQPTASWASVSRAATTELEIVLDALRSEVAAPHLDALIRLLDALLHASNESEWSAVEALAAEQNARAIASEEPIVLFASLFWTEHGTAWPAIYLVEKSASAKCARLDKVGAFFEALEPGRSAPALCFATNLIFA